jgi:hypothetical protein
MSNEITPESINTKLDKIISGIFKSEPEDNKEKAKDIEVPTPAPKVEEPETPAEKKTRSFFDILWNGGE